MRCKKCGNPAGLLSRTCQQCRRASSGPVSYPSSNEDMSQNMLMHQLLIHNVIASGREDERSSSPSPEPERVQDPAPVEVQQVPDSSFASSGSSDYSSNYDSGTSYDSGSSSYDSGSSSSFDSGSSSFG